MWELKYTPLERLFNSEVYDALRKTLKYESLMLSVREEEKRVVFSTYHEMYDSDGKDISISKECDIVEMVADEVHCIGMETEELEILKESLAQALEEATKAYKKATEGKAA